MPFPLVLRRMNNVNTDKKAIEMLVSRAVENVYPTPDALAELLKSGKRITVYLGVDPSGPNLHIGHAISMKKLAELQKLGHKCVLLIGDFTAMIGDPTDKSAARVKLTREQVLENCKGYKEQASKILDFGGVNPVELKFNSEWLGKMSFTEVVELASHFTVQQMLERDMFAKRMAENPPKPIYMHEFLYPLMQGYDSVAMDVDLEIGGNDQTFNMLAGRTLMREIKNKEKLVLTCKLLTDPTGKKMGKSEGNMITLVDSPEDMYGKVMSWTDGMIVPGFELVTDVAKGEIEKMKEAMEDGENPMKYKKMLAHEIVKTFLGEGLANQAELYFQMVHQEHELPSVISDVKASEGMTIVDVLAAFKIAPSKQQARRLIEQGGVKVDGVIVTDVQALAVKGTVIQKGKLVFVKVI